MMSEKIVLAIIGGLAGTRSVGILRL